MEKVKYMLVFSRIVESGSYTAAASQMQMSVSAVSQIISRLENELDIKLLNRSTRHLSLTEAGKIYFLGCQQMLAEVQKLHEKLHTINNKPIGTLHIGSSSTMAQNVLTPVTATLLKKNPGLNVNLVTGSPIPDVISAGLDLVVRIGPSQDACLFSKLIGQMPLVICAAKSWLSHHRTPENINHIDPLNWLTYSVSPWNGFELLSPQGEKMRLSPQGRYNTNDTQTLISWLISGTGIACVPLLWVMDKIEAGSVKILFTDYALTERPVYAIYRKKDKLPVRVQIGLNALTAYFDAMTERYRVFQCR